MERKLAPQVELGRMIPNMFSGMLVRRTTCTGCRAAGRSGVSDRREEYYDLALQLQGCKDLDDCLERYFVPEEMDGDDKCVCRARVLGMSKAESTMCHIQCTI